MENKKIETQNQIISNNKNSSVNKIPLFYSNNIREISAITIIKNISELLEDICDENTKNFKENKLILYLFKIIN